jgi:diaminopimelate epimerase
MSHWPPRPTVGSRFYKAHGLGNDYLVFEEAAGWRVEAPAVRAVCDRTRGVGSDGIVVLLREAVDGAFALRMFNPDGSEFERSGNGLRILASHLHRRGLVAGEPFTVRVGGDDVGMVVHGSSRSTFDVSVEMGRAHTGCDSVGMDPEALDAEGRLPGPEGEPLDVVPVSVGNPHLVVFMPDLDPTRLPTFGAFLSAHASLAHGANVQFAAVDSDGVCRALIWERGVGRTSASGTSACAVATAAVATGRVEPGPVEVVMEGGSLRVEVSAALDILLRGPVEAVCEGELDAAFFGAMGVGEKVGV